jgi:multidrug resistance efflux pump
VLDNPLTPNDERAPLDASAGLASVQYQIARYQRRQAEKGPSASSIAAERTQVASAQANLDKLLAGTGANAWPAHLQLASLETRRERARMALAKAVLVAPRDGVIAAVNLEIGQRTPAGQPAIVLIDDGAYHLDVTVDEIDVARLREGQTVTVTLDALPDTTFAGQIGLIAPLGAVTGGAVSYSVRVDLSGGDPARRHDRQRADRRRAPHRRAGSAQRGPAHPQHRRQSLRDRA